MYCKMCGNEVSEGTAVCPSCGNPMDHTQAGQAAAPVFEQTPASYPTQTTNNYYTQNQGEQMTVGDWIKTMLLCWIPVANIILMIIWAVGQPDGKMKARQNWARASFALAGICIALYVVFVVIFGGMLFGSMY